jgi:hypothetical protein
VAERRPYVFRRIARTARSEREPRTPTLALILVAFVLAYCSLSLGSSFARSLVVSETGLVQTLGAGALAAASVSLFVAYHRSRRALLVLLALALFVGAGEELSWGQHLLDFEPPPDIAAANEQGELTLHNLTVLQGGRGGELNPMDRAFFALGLAFTLLAPLAGAVSTRIRLQIERLVPLVPLGFGLLFIGNFALSKIAEAVASASSGHAIVEIKETNSAIVLLLVGAHLARLSRGSRHGW